MQEQTNKDRAAALPPMDYEFPLGGYLWRVTYINVGKLRFTAKMVGLIQTENANPGKAEDVEKPGLIVF